MYFLHGCYFLGFTTDGEFKLLRTAGKSCPVSVVGLIQNARSQARSMREETMTKYFTLDNQGNQLKCSTYIKFTFVYFIFTF